MDLSCEGEGRRQNGIVDGDGGVAGVGWRFER